MKYQIWYGRKWPLCQPDSNKARIISYARRLRLAYGDTEKSIIRIRKIDA